jgi:hypothetical protein
MIVPGTRFYAQKNFAPKLPVDMSGKQPPFSEYRLPKIAQHDKKGEY